MLMIFISDVHIIISMFCILDMSPVVEAHSSSSWISGDNSEFRNEYFQLVFYSTFVVIIFLIVTETILHETPYTFRF